MKISGSHVPWTLYNMEKHEKNILILVETSLLDTRFPLISFPINAHLRNGAATSSQWKMCHPGGVFVPVGNHSMNWKWSQNVDKTSENPNQN